jgi:tellurite resistance protein
MKTTAEKFRDTVGLAFGTFGKDENSVFNIDVIISKMKRLTTAARGFAENLAKLKNKKVPQAVIDQLVAMGPAQGNIVAKGLLASGSKLSTFLGLSKSLYGTGAQAQAVASTTSNATYEININKAVISASDIIREIRTYEKKTGRKYLVN